MFFYTNVTTDGNKILFRGHKDGNKITQKVPFSPSLFIESKTGEFKSLHGKSLERKQFETIKELRDFKTQISDIANMDVYGTAKMPTQFINEYFDDAIDYSVANISIKSLDIETKVEHGTIDTTNTPEEITLITLKDFNTKEIVTFGCWDFEYDEERISEILQKQGIKLNLDRLKNFKYIQCSDEKELLSNFIEYWSNDYPDIVTGWNIELYDIPYLSNRIKMILGEKHLKRLSVWGSIYEKTIHVTEYRQEPSFEWRGISVLDYLALYKKFSFKKLENNKLDTVAKEELKREKLTHEYGSFREFYEKDPYAFTLYNIIDVDLIDELEERIQLIQLIISIAYEAKINYNDVFSPIASWESILYNFLMKHKIIPVIKSPGTPKEIMGGYVKDIDPSSYDWDVAFDATSLYPSIIMALNMSPETIVEDSNLLQSSFSSVMSIVNREIDLSHLKSSGNAYAANGQEFTTERKGWFPTIIQYFFDQRQIAKKEMLRLESLHSDDIEILNKIVSLNVRQMAFKILLNALFGAMANEYFSYYDTRIAEGITMSGQVIILNAEKTVNELLTKLIGKEGKYCYYCDTDSLHITLNEIVKEYYSEMYPREISHVLSKICEDLISPKITETCQNLGNYLNLYQSDKISFKREFIANRGIYTAKKKYCLNVFNSEGVEYDPPKIKVMGLEIVRSSTPNILRSKLKDAVKILLTGENDELLDFVEQFRKDWHKLDYTQIGFPRGVNGLLKYEDGNSFKKGTPFHVKASLMFNYCLSKHKITDVEPIRDGDRIKFLYLKEPNAIHNNGIAFMDTLPMEFNLHKYIDYDIMFQKGFLDPLSKLSDILNWKVEYTANLDDMFS